MNLSIYIAVAYYVSKGNLAQVVSEESESAINPEISVRPPTSKGPMLPLSHWFPLFSFLFFSFLLLLFFSSNLSPICSFSASSLHDSYTSSFTTSPTPPPNFQQTHHSHPHDPIFFSLPPFLSFLPPHKLSTTTPIEKAHCHMSPSSISFLHYSNQFIFILNKIKLHIIKFISVKRCESINF